MILFQDFTRQWKELGPDILRATNQVGESGWYILGKQVQNFEIALAKQTGFSFATGVANGLDAIEISLRALGIQKGDKVLTTPLSAFATTLAIIRAGGVPVFCDTDSEGLIDLNLAEKCIQENSIKYFVPVHLYGQRINISHMNALKLKTGVYIVEDAAQSIGAHKLNPFTETASEFVTTSFYPTKNLGAIGDGGAVFTNSQSLAKKVENLRNYGQTEKYIHDELGLNSRLDELQAAYLNVYLKHLEKWTQRRVEIAETYQSNIKNPKMRMLKDSVTSVWHLFPIFTSSSEDRRSFMSYLESQDVQTAIHYPHLITNQKALKGQSFQIYNDLKVAENLALTTISLPINPYITNEEIFKVVEACNKWST